MNSYAQLPHPNDTLDNGKKVPFNQFLGRFSVFNEVLGAGRWYSFNASYSLIKSDLILLDVTVGANRVPYGRGEWRKEEWDSFHVPVGLSVFLGRRRSRLNLRFGYKVKVFPAWYSDDRGPYPVCAGYCPTPPEHSMFLALGYVFQHQYGFYTGAHAYGLMTFPLPESARRFGNTPYFYPSVGLTLGYRLPSNQQHREWRERGFKRRVLRMEKPKQKKRKSGDELDHVFYDTEPLHTDSAELNEIEKELAKLKRRHQRYLKQEQRLNGRSHFFGEFFGAAGVWSLNYSYTHPIAKSKTWMMDYRAGFGTDTEDAAMPFHVGVKAMKNYRGSGIHIGLTPRYNWTNGKVGLVYFVEHNVEFHFAYGLTGGVSFYFFYDPNRFLFERDWAPYGSFFLGYRLPQMKKT